MYKLQHQHIINKDIIQEQVENDGTLTQVQINFFA